MKVFLQDDEHSFSYDDLLDAINRSQTYFAYLQTNDLFTYFTNLIVALISDSPITLIDSDFSEEEIKRLGIVDTNQSIIICKPTFQSIYQIIERLKSSTSIITIFTSGTTGQPKKVEHTYFSLSRGVKTGEKFEHDMWGYAYNPTHMAGLQVFFQALENANSIINIFNRSRSQILGTIRRERITHISATPTFYRMLLPPDEKFENVRRITLGGEKTDSKLFISIQEMFPNAKITNVYASTEAGTLFASHGSNFKIPDNLKDKFKVVNEELFIHASLIGASQSFNIIDNFYPSGDLIEWVDESQGIFKFKSRKNELINVGGYKVNPHEVEESIRKIYGIKDVYVYGRFNSVLGNILCADIVTESGIEITDLSIRQSLSNQLQDFKIPRRIKFKDKLDLTRTGKMKRI